MRPVGVGRQTLCSACFPAQFLMPAAVGGRHQAIPRFVRLSVCPSLGFTWGELTSQNLWSRYVRRFVDINNLAQCVELMGEDLPRYSNKIQPVSLRKCPCDH